MWEHGWAAGEGLAQGFIGESWALGRQRCIFTPFFSDTYCCNLPDHQPVGRTPALQPFPSPTSTGIVLGLVVAQPRCKACGHLLGRGGAWQHCGAVAVG